MQDIYDTIKNSRTIQIIIIIAAILLIVLKGKSTSTTPGIATPGTVNGIEYDIEQLPTVGTTQKSTPKPRTVTTTKAGSLETTPRDISGGRNLLTVPLGAIVTVLGGPIPDPQGTNKTYYSVQYNGKVGYLGSDTSNFN